MAESLLSSVPQSAWGASGISNPSLIYSKTITGTIPSGGNSFTAELDGVPSRVNSDSSISIYRFLQVVVPNWKSWNEISVQQQNSSNILMRGNNPSGLQTILGYTILDWDGISYSSIGITSSVKYIIVTNFEGSVTLVFSIYSYDVSFL